MKYNFIILVRPVCSIEIQVNLIEYQSDDSYYENGDIYGA